MLRPCKTEKHSSLCPTASDHMNILATTSTPQSLSWKLEMLCGCITLNRRRTFLQNCKKPWQGPYVIIKRINDLIYRGQLGRWSRPRVMHFNRLWKYHGENPPHWLITTGPNPTVYGVYRDISWQSAIWCENSGHSQPGNWSHWWHHYFWDHCSSSFWWWVNTPEKFSSTSETWTIWKWPPGTGDIEGGGSVTIQALSDRSVYPLDDSRSS